MKPMIRAFAPVAVCFAALVFAFTSNVMLAGIPLFLCGMPLSLFYAGYAIGKNGYGLQSPIKAPAIGPESYEYETDDIAWIKEQRRKRRLSASQSQQVENRVSKELNR